MASRGRKAPAKKTSKAPNAARKSSVVESTPNPDTKPSLSQINSTTSNGVHADSEADMASQGHSTPPPGVLTPTALERGAGSVIDAASEMPDSEVPGLPFVGTPPEIEDDEYRLWKQKTKKERAMIAAARHRLFRGDKLNSDEEALLRSRSSMRKWQQMQQDHLGGQSLTDADDGKPNPDQGGPTLAEGLEPEEESMLPDYYHPLAAIPDLDPRLRWENDTEGHVIEQNAEFLRLYPSGKFVAPEGKLSKRMADNMHQIQETRKIVSKIGVVKQMQLQTQIYQNQFTKYEPAPFFEADVKDHVMTDDGPLMAPWVSKAALTRSIGEIFFHAGFEEFQPSAIDAIADMAGHFFQNLCSNFSNYLTEEKISVSAPITTATSTQKTTSSDTLLKPAVTSEEAVLHTLHESGLSITDLDYYAHEEMDRVAQRLQTMYDRMRSHYAELLKPALTDDTAQGSGSFETGEQYTSGDFADDLGEDFFGFKELGLDREFGLVNLSVPLHLLHNRLSTAAQQTTNTGDASEKLFAPPPPFPRVNVENVEQEIGLVKGFFKKRLKENGDRPLPEDLDLPVKQRRGYGRARVPATGKIGDGKALGNSPQKKAPVAAKSVGATASKLNLTNGVNIKEEKKKKTAQTINGVNGDVTVDSNNIGVDEVDHAGMDPPSPSPHVNGDVSSEKAQGSQQQQQKTPSKPPLKQRPSSASLKVDTDANGDTMTNGDFSDMINGMDSPPHSADGSGPDQRRKVKSKGKNKAKDGDGDAAMISPESL
ncbi:Transcriptional activator spt7 [Neophaeococcomyces mojaviensis]|uniref:Transcriptional activator spt7 n=1 Tax=Neophaeococcomyces mojaviensis TaxID=3383035 RepID=A0ACC2ZW94_9EURO|nr:Transcriptional activator spt7 [Knufia sp. JES_112]